MAIVGRFWQTVYAQTVTGLSAIKVRVLWPAESHPAVRWGSYLQKWFIRLHLERK